MTTELYKKSGAGAAGGAAGATGEAEGSGHAEAGKKGGDDVIDADYKDVN